VETFKTNHAIVSGGASGIGRALVHRLIGRGMRVSAIDLPSDALATLKRLTGVDTFAADVTNHHELENAFNTACTQHGIPDALCALAGTVGQRVSALEIDLERWRELMDVHLFGTMDLAQLFARRYVASVGAGSPSSASVVVTSSIVAAGGFSNQADYGTAKAALSYLTKVLAVEWAPHNLRVNAVAPGFTETPMVTQLQNEGYDLAPVKERTPMARLAKPDEIAKAIEYLAYDADYVTGATLYVDGGWTAVGR